MTTWYLGLATSGHDPALALVDAAGQVVYAEATERYVQDKRAWGIAPDHAPHLERVFRAAGVDPARDEVVIAASWKSLKNERPATQTNMRLPDAAWLAVLQSRAMQDAGASLLRLRMTDAPPQARRYEHHLCHAVNAAYSAPFDDAACLVIDGEGDVGATSLYRMTGRRMKRVFRSWGPGSLGMYYAWLTEACGFDWRLGEEWKVMGMAAFGTPDPELVRWLRGLLDVNRGRMRLPPGLTLADADARVAPHARRPDEPIMKAAELAASGQQAYAQMVDEILTEGLDAPGGKLILSGGCALNSSYNGTICGRLGFDDVFVPSAPADDGNAIGAALLAWMEDHPGSPIPRGDGSPFLGARPDRRVIDKLGAKGGFARVTDLAGRAAKVVADKLAEGRIVGVMRGRAEFGPRALGHRSILADPRPAEMKDRINAQVKGREAYRPFAPVIPTARVPEWFDGATRTSPYMSFTLPWKPQVRERVPAVVHADGTGRLQTVDAATNPWMTDLIAAFEARTGVPVVLNTSFNIMGKPIVHSVEDAVAVLMTTGLDAVLLEDVLVEAG
ncbi:carbamoyl transferase [Rhodobacteraceae bacterium 2CG4]|uniref:Carbamoyl transferase n=1 Tax=Halovulum marinum TaxID=2662447 RepID=A0A6L5Z6G6_9RHOB|nr:carbamoyltransferase C-terminal domain-containing protein [Halovulum marinum]MSU91690.1 carbamoyl transferase [Halovulum marinum]